MFIVLLSSCDFVLNKILIVVLFFSLLPSCFSIIISSKSHFPTYSLLTTNHVNCSQDVDCIISNYFCVNGSCQRLAFPGQYCSTHSDCVSYHVLGNASCTAECKIDSRCGGGVATSFCCAGIPEFNTCNITQEKKAKETMCAAGFTCLRGSESEEYTCQFQKSSQWVVGVVITVLGCIVLNLGLNLQKYAFRMNANLEEDLQLPPYKMPLWLLGFVIWILGNVANFVALSFAAQSLITALGAVSLVTNFIAAPLINKEPFGWIDFASGTLMVAGSVLVVWFANHENTSSSLCSLLSYYTRISMIVYLSLMLLMVFILWIFINIMEINLQKLHPSLSSVHSSSPALYHWHHQWRTKVFQINATISKSSRWYKYVLPFSYAGMGGALGGLTVLFAKSSAELITTTLSGDNQFIYLPTYLILAAIVVTGVGQVYYINQGLQRYDALLQVPAFYVIYTLCGILSGGVYFDDFKNFQPFQLVFFCLGVGLTFLGVILLGFRLTQVEETRFEVMDSPSLSSPNAIHPMKPTPPLSLVTSSKAIDHDPMAQEGWETLPSASPTSSLTHIMVPKTLSTPTPTFSSHRPEWQLDSNIQEPMSLPHTVPDPSSGSSSGSGPTSVTSANHSPGT